MLHSHRRTRNYLQHLHDFAYMGLTGTPYVVGSVQLRFRWDLAKKTQLYGGNVRILFGNVGIFDVFWHILVYFDGILMHFDASKLAQNGSKFAQSIKTFQS